MKKCNKTIRVGVHPSVKIGGVTIGECQNECLPEMTVCWRHASREALVMHIKNLYGRLQKAKEDTR